MSEKNTKYEISANISKQILYSNTLEVCEEEGLSRDPPSQEASAKSFAIPYSTT